MDTKKLRQKILDLAIHGKLVPQDPNDEPASVLLERIRAEKERLIAEGKIKRSKKSDASDTSHYENRQVGEANVPFEVPEGWCWCRLDEVADYGKCQTTSIEDIDDDSWILELEDIEKDSGRVLKRCTKADREIKGVRHSFCKGNVLYSKLRTYLNKVLIANEAGFCTTEIMPIECGPCLHPTYLCHVLRSKYFLDYTVQCGYGVKMPRLSTADACKAMIPVAPIEEQKRIAVMIENLDLLIDLLDENKQILEAGILQAKSKILDLAIHGKLVSQDANDEPASVLLKQINPKAVASCDNPHYVGEIPSNWVWTTLGSIGKWQSGGTPSRMHKEYYGGNIPWLKTGDLNDGLVTDIPEHITELGLENSSAKLNPAGSVLIAMYGATIGKVGVLGIPATTNQACCACIEYKGITQQYLFLFLLASKANFVAAGGGGAQPNISKEIITKTLISLPPIEEQNRIVAKVNELFSQLDMIEKSLQA